MGIEGRLAGMAFRYDERGVQSGHAVVEDEILAQGFIIQVFRFHLAQVFDAPLQLKIEHSLRAFWFRSCAFVLCVIPRRTRRAAVRISAPPLNTTLPRVTWVLE